jgi:uncharacterized protein
MLRKILLIGVGVAALAVAVFAVVIAAGLSPAGTPLAAPTGAAGFPVRQAEAAPLAQEIVQARTGIRVTGEGIVRVSPDAARVTLGVEVSAATAGAALQQAADQMTAVVNQLRGLGIEERDIQTSQFDLSPVYDYNRNQVDRPGIPPSPDGAPVLVGYRVTNLVTVTLRDITRVGDVLDAVVASGATRVHGIGFTVTDPAAAADQAREQAMNNARNTAQQLANLAGVGLGRAIAIEEISTPSPMPMDMVERVGAPMAQPATTPVAPGTQEVRTIISVTYAIQ